MWRLTMLVALLASVQAVPRVAGGVAATITDFPYQCALMSNPGNALLCSCSLISRSWILTAASCLRRIVGASQTTLRPVDIQVFFGAQRLDSPQYIFPVRTVQIHPTYSYLTSPVKRVDLAWLQVDWRVPVTPRTLPTILASLSESTFWAPGTAAAVTGWGATSPADALSLNLQRVDAPIQPVAVCNGQLTSQGQQPVNGAIYLCAGAGGTGPCLADGGGALVAFSGGQFRQVGVVSSSTALPTGGNSSTCGGAGYYGIYTAVAPYRDYIQSFIDEPLYVGSAARLSGGLLVSVLVALLFAFSL